MSDDLSPNLSLPFLLPGQAQKHVTVNDSLQLLDALVQLAVLRRDLPAPPAAPVAGARYLVPAGATGDWAGQEGRIALHDGTGWTFLVPRPGWRARVLAEGVDLAHDGLGWTEGPSRFGVNATPDTTNRLAVAGAATLLTHAGSDHRLKINRAGDNDTASIVFQSDWTGLAEIGLAGGPDLVIKAFDGTTWYEALRVGAAGRTLVADGAELYHRGNILGPVAQAAGAPAGAVLERGSTADGEWLRLADGTQICSHAMTASDMAATVWTYPAAFAAPPVLSGTAEATVLSVLCLDGAPGTAAAGFSLRDAAGLRRADRVHLLAVGRWG